MKQEIFITQDKCKLVCSLWDNVVHPKGVVQIIHGMDEYIDKYDCFAKFLNQNGYIVFGDDHRGHGRTAGDHKKIGKTGGLADIFASIVNDELEILKYLKGKYKVPVLIFGQGYGSLITQRILGNTKLCAAGVCLSGSGKYSWGMLWVGLITTWTGMKIWGQDACARFIEFWLPGRKRPNLSPWRGECFSYGFYYSLLKNMMQLNTDACPETPLLIISGGRDITNMNGRLAASLYRAYKTHDMKNLTFIIYPNAHHELVIDSDYPDIQTDILEFFNRATEK